MVESVNYDRIASVYDERYQANRYEGIEVFLRSFIGNVGAAAEVGCGTGHWLAAIGDRVRTIAGLDLSPEMLQRARRTAPHASLARARAEQLPWPTARFNRLYCINALHHFADTRRFMIEARRVLRPGGGLLIIGLDPHTGQDRWWIYDYFPSALRADLSRYPPTAEIRESLAAAGFVNAATEVAQHLPRDIPFQVALQRGHLDRRSRSQTLIISDQEYEEGMARLGAEQPILKADLRLYATVAWAANS
jgi:ubiquinone/menaquinone biosynthesis C-methylase UbiE